MLIAETRPNPIVATLPFDQDGLHHGFLRLPYSRDDSAWGALMIPIAVIRNGEGPTALLTGANHGDEYEGPIALQSLIHEIDLARVGGRIIIVPYMNAPAFWAGRRTSPLDGVNMNRCFPGNPAGSPTEKIADYFMRKLLPMADVVVDIHSGGKSLEFIPFAAAHLLDDGDQQAACIAAMRAFSAPYSMTLREIDAVGMYDTAAEDAGKVFVSTELGGGGTTRPEMVAIAKRGITNVLKHAGIMEGSPELCDSRDIDTTEGDCFRFSQEEGLLEPLVELGAPVAKGAPLARVWPTSRTGAPLAEVTAGVDGLLVGRHFPGLVMRGDCLAVVAREVSPEELS